MGSRLGQVDGSFLYEVYWEKDRGDDDGIRYCGRREWTTDSRR